MNLLQNKLVMGWALGVSTFFLMGFTFSSPDFQAGQIISASEVNAKFAELESLLQHFERQGNDIIITGANLHVRSGSGSTSAAPNGLGNVIIGYNEMRTDDSDPETDDSNFRTGSHYLIVGSEHNYSRFGGIVASRRNTSEGDYACVTGGHSGIASGSRSSITGGQHGRASGTVAATHGGFKANATHLGSTVTGDGILGTASTSAWAVVP